MTQDNEQLNDREFNLLEVTKGLTPEEVIQLVKSQITPEAVARFKSDTKQKQLRAKYDEEAKKIPNGLPMTARALAQLKNKYRAMGLEIY